MTQDPDLEALVEAVAAVTRAFKVTMDDTAHGAHGRMPPSDMAAILYLAQSPGARLSDLAAYLRVGLTTASSLVDRLERQGLVDRTRSTADRRAVGLQLTPDGIALNAEASAETRVMCEAMLSALDTSERAPFVAAMRKIGARLDPG